jgi:rubrerythrin
MHGYKNKTKCKQFKKGLHESLKDEHKAPIDYAKLKLVAPNKTIKNKITHIQNQEKQHFKTLSEIAKKLHKR